MISNSNTPQQILTEEFKKRLNRNARYSLRAFARDLGISAASASEYLNGKHGISSKNAARIAKALGLQQELLQVPHLSSQTETQRKLDVELFSAISDWRHFTFLEYLKINNGPNWKKLAKQLATTVLNTKDIVCRMERLGFCKRSSRKYVLTEPNNTVESRSTNDAIRSFHRAVLDRAINRLDRDNVERRVFRSTVIAVDTEQIGEVNALITKFHSDMDALLEKSKKKNAVYCLSTQFFHIMEDL